MWRTDHCDVSVCVQFPLGGEEKGAVEVLAGLEAEIQGLHDRAHALALDRQTLVGP